MNLNLVSPLRKAYHQHDSSISFEEEDHKYFVKNENYTSCTTFVKTFFNPFDQISISRMCVQKRNPHISEASLKVESQKLRETWSKASADGTLMHESFENFYNFGTVKESNEMNPFLTFTQTMYEKGYRPYRSEWSVYDEKHKLAGTIDQLYYKQDENVLYMYDWKRSKNISTYSFGKKGLLCNFYLNDCNFIHYSLQQNIYKYILETNYNKKVVDMHLFVVNPKTYRSSIIKLPDMQNEIQNMLKYKEIELTQESFQTFVDNEDIIQNDH
jgi:hypothetical protein